MVVLGIETSCDETAASVVDASGVRSDVVYSQTVHEAYGGVVPELASRGHVEKIGAVVAASLHEAGVERPDVVAATSGPGLMGAVLVGLSYAKGLAAAWNVPFIGVNHLEGHLLSPLLEDPPPSFPFLALIVSGGHSTLYLAEDIGKYRVLGSTRDDAAGEAYDKTARLLGLGYPGGPVVDRLAASGDPSVVPLPRPMPGELDFSFSGLKTAVRTRVQRFPDDKVEDVCAAFQAAVLDCLMDRIHAASRATGITQVAIAGGVAANSGLRARLLASGLNVTMPPKSRCTDNGAMIANVGRLHALRGTTHDLSFAAQPGWALT